MGWATQHIEQLEQGKTVSFRPRGLSMSGKIESGQLCTMEPVDPQTLHVGDLVLCKVNRYQYLHLIKAIDGQRYQIGNNRGRINGWISANSVYGKCVKVRIDQVSQRATCGLFKGGEHCEHLDLLHRTPRNAANRW